MQLTVLSYVCIETSLAVAWHLTAVTGLTYDAIVLVLHNYAIGDGRLSRFSRMSRSLFLVRFLSLVMVEDNLAHTH